MVARGPVKCLYRHYTLLPGRNSFGTMGFWMEVLLAYIKRLPPSWIPLAGCGGHRWQRRD